MIAETAVIHPNVVLGDNVTIEDFCIIGIPFSSATEGQTTVIGDNAVLRSGTYIYAGCKIGRNFQTGNKANIRELNNIGDDVSIGTMSVIEHHVEICDNVRIHSQAFIPEYSRLEKNAWIGPNVVLTNARYPRSKTAKDDLMGPVIEENSKIGANSTILPGVTIGRNSLVGAGSVVVKNVPAGVIVVGNPAAITRKIDY
ncbi:MAG: hypothetical protein COB30_006920 [Ectothiorhodospiraceae bacterium]|nr:hypothetical protein [Ectothiorhodospiraceae bacterium]